MRNLTLCTLFVIFLFLTYALLFPFFRGCYSPLSMLHSNSSKQHSVLFFSTIQQEGITKILHQGRYGQLQNSLNDFFYKFIYENQLFWARKYQQNNSPASDQEETDGTPHNPVHTVFLGDQFSSEHLFDDQFRDQLNRFEQRVFRRHSGVDQIHVAGNNDVGYGYSVTPYRLDRFVTAFNTPQNHIKEIGGVDFMWPLSISLDGSDLKLMRETWKFIEEVAQKRHSTKSQRPLVLILHIPLFKNEKTHSCRSSFRIRKADDGMVQMQSQLTMLTTKKLLSLLRPNVVISGHDHGGCNVIHEWTDEDSGEVHRVPEYVQRSMQGDYGGHTGILSFETQPSVDGQDWNFTYVSCGFTYMQVVVVFLVIIIAEVLLIGVLFIRVAINLVWRFTTGFFQLLWKAFQDKRKTKVE